VDIVPGRGFGALFTARQLLLFQGRTDFYHLLISIHHCAGLIVRSCRIWILSSYGPKNIFAINEATGKVIAEPVTED
jgi:hypothetical protein